MGQLRMGQYKSSRPNFEKYTQMLEQASSNMSMMESHLKQLVKTQRVADSRIFEDEHRIVQGTQDFLLINGAEIPILRFDPPQGEAWKCERVSLGTTDALLGAFLGFRDTFNYGRLAETCPCGISNNTGVLPGAVYSDSFSNRLYLPERVRLFFLGISEAGPESFSVIPFDGNIQVQVLKRHSNKISSELAFALSGDVEYAEGAHFTETPPQGIEDDDRGDAPLEPHDQRHGDVENTSGMLDTDQDDNQWSGENAPPSAELPPRPRPSWPQRIEHAVEEIVEDSVEFIEKVL
jgi:hypothetical protein